MENDLYRRRAAQKRAGEGALKDEKSPTNEVPEALKAQMKFIEATKSHTKDISKDLFASGRDKEEELQRELAAAVPNKKL